MQTFLPYRSYVQSAAAIDNGRLNKQITEVWQIYTAITNPHDHGWQHHPAVNMWRGHVNSLLDYGLACYIEWRYRFVTGGRGGKELHRAGEQIFSTVPLVVTDLRDLLNTPQPSWLTERFCSVHRSVLLGKALEDGPNITEWYDQFDWREQPAKRLPPKRKGDRGSWPYIWPV